MSPGPIIKGFDVIKGDASGLCACLKGLAINAFAFATVKKAFHGRILVTISSATHADSQAFLSQERLIAFTGVGPPTIRVMESPGLWTATSDC
jgi:hypothetical protein